MGIIKIHFGHCVGKYGPGTKLTHVLCARISLLQLGVVLVLHKIKSYFPTWKKSLFCIHYEKSPCLLREKNMCFILVKILIFRHFFFFFFPSFSLHLEKNWNHHLSMDYRMINKKVYSFHIQWNLRFLFKFKIALDSVNID